MNDWIDPQMASHPHCDAPRSRREFLQKAGGGFGALALTAMLSSDSSTAADTWDAVLEATTDFCHALFNANEFVVID